MRGSRWRGRCVVSTPWYRPVRVRPLRGACVRVCDLGLAMYRACVRVLLVPNLAME